MLLVGDILGHLNARILPLQSVDAPIGSLFLVMKLNLLHGKRIILYRDYLTIDKPGAHVSPRASGQGKENDGGSV